VFSEIIRLAAESTYDFRPKANPDDPLRYLFEEWVPYYRLKWAIARHMQPRRILEIGVRFGYSGLAFVSACPESEYVGIDNDSETFGGTRGALDWARKAMAGHQTRLIRADSQEFSAFPGGRFDLIHMDGQQNETGLNHDLALALRQAEYVLVDGFFWTRTNFLALSELLLRYRNEIEYYGVIPGYAGDLLIRPKHEARESSTEAAASSLALRPAYTSHYYLNDCGGFDAFKQAGAAVPADARLRAMAALADYARVGRALDLGCGRGEMALALAAMGHEVTAIDYSADAIAIAQEAASRHGVGTERLNLLCADVTTYPFSGRYDVAVASDLIEHMNPAELEDLYAGIAAHLTPDGFFAVHTFPNRWFYQYEYPRRVRAAEALGAYLPQNPRSRYEQWMHINEQSPRVLRRQLRRHFPFVLLWFARHDFLRPFENLEQPYSRAAMRAAPDLFTVASLVPIEASALAEALRMSPVSEAQASAVHLRICGAPAHVAAGERFELTVQIMNGSGRKLYSGPPNPVQLSYHWLDAQGRVLVFEGRRTPLIPALRAAERRCTMRVVAPTQAGAAVLRATLVQESVRWFDQAPVSCFDDARITIG